MENEDRKNFAAYFATLQADADALAALLLAGLASLGLHSLDGLSPTEWLLEKRKLELQKRLIALEDTNPAAAAALQQYIDDLGNSES